MLEGLNGCFMIGHKPTDMSAVVWKKNKGVCPTEMLSN